MPVAIVTGASKGLGRALARLARRAGLVRRDRRPRRRAPWPPPPPSSPPAPRGRHRRRRHRPGPPRRRWSPPPSGSDGIDLLVNNASTLGASPLPPLADTRPRRLPAPRSRSTSSRPLALVQAALPALGRRTATIVERHLRRRRRGLRGLGRLRRRPRPRSSSSSGCSPPSEPDVRVYWRRPRRHAHRDAPGRLPRRGHLRPARRPSDSVPGLLALIDGDQPSGRYAARARGGERDDARRRPLEPAPGAARLRPAPRARGPRAARGQRRPPRRRAPARVARAPTTPVHARFTDLARLPRPGDLVVVNTSATVPAAVDAVTTGRRPPSSSTSRPSCPPGCGWSSCAGRIPTAASRRRIDADLAPARRR